jgi:hypothetical protein
LKSIGTFTKRPKKGTYRERRGKPRFKSSKPCKGLKTRKGYGRMQPQNPSMTVSKATHGLSDIHRRLIRLGPGPSYKKANRLSTLVDEAKELDRLYDDSEESSYMHQSFLRKIRRVGSHRKDRFNPETVRSPGMFDRHKTLVIVSIDMFRDEAHERFKRTLRRLLRQARELIRVFPHLKVKFPLFNGKRVMTSLMSYTSHYKTVAPYRRNSRKGVDLVRPAGSSQLPNRPSREKIAK